MSGSGSSMVDGIEIKRAEFISGPILSPKSSMLPTILEFQYSFGFNCKRLFNLCLIVPNVLVFASGNLIHFFTISTKQIKTRRSCCGGGIGYITKNPNPKYNYLTIAENGQKPPIIIYEYPKMSVISVCEGGTEQCYTYVDFSPDGEMMVSQGGAPDYMITIWQWKTGTIVLRSRSFQNTVHKVLFSMYNPGQLTSSGTGHIKFWSICQTFTGLKLEGVHGRFGKTEICDILGSYAMPLGTVLSGSEWGNVLVWQEGLIKLEVCRKNRKTCHTGPITQISMTDGEVMTVGTDGYVRIWFWETVELADPPDNDLFVEIEPIYEYLVGDKLHTCSIHSLIKMDSKSYWWYAQDSNGGIWTVDISPENRPEPCEMLFQCHAGAVEGLASCPFGPFIATLGAGGRLHLYDYKRNVMIGSKQFGSSGKCLIWLPMTIDPSGVVLVLGFDDGVVRIICVNLDTHYRGERVTLLQSWKPHRKAVTVMSINPRESLLVTGSADSTIFIHQIVGQEPFVTFLPIGFVDLPSEATALNWKPNMFSTVMVGCLRGQVLEFDVPERARSYTTLSYRLTHIEIKTCVFKSTKSALRREIRLKEIEDLKLLKRAKKMRSLEKLRKENPDIKVDEETFLADSDSEEELEPIFIPAIPNSVLWLQYTSENTIWLSMGEFDAGYIYEFQFDSDEPMRCTPIQDAEDLELNSYLYVDKFIIFGQQNGAVRINRLADDFRNLSDYWMLNMHDNYNGRINHIALSFDRKYLFTVGNDGNIFSYKWREQFEAPTTAVPTPIQIPIDPVSDIDDPEMLSLEDEKQKNNADMRLRIANGRKDDVLRILSDYELQFRDILRRNKELPLRQRVEPNKTELDKRITQIIQDNFDDQMNIVKRKLAFDVEKCKLLSKKVTEYFIEPLDTFPIQLLGIRTSDKLQTFRINKLSDTFLFSQNIVEEMIKIENDRKRVITIAEDSGPVETIKPLKKLESFLEVLPSANESKLGLQMSRLLRQYRTRKANELKYSEMWEKLNAMVPDPNKNDPQDILALQEADKSIGDYKLRTDPMYVQTDDEQSSVSYKFRELLRIREELCTVRKEFNTRVFALRNAKMALVTYVHEQLDILIRIHTELPKDSRKFPQTIPKIDEQLEYPDKLLKLKIETMDGVVAIKKPSEFQLITKGQSKMLHVDTNFPNDLGDITEENLLANSQNATDWEKELCQIRLAEKLFEQKNIILDIDERIRNFDANMQSLRDSRLDIEVRAKLLDTFLLTLNQELWVLKDFKSLEDQLVDRLNVQITARNDINADLSAQRAQIENHKRNIESLQQQEIFIAQQFNVTCMGNKFSDFLRKIYKKKNRPVRDVNPDESESSEESEESSDDDDEQDAISQDSKEIGPIFMDETVCPPGCDPTLYEAALDLRGNRHRAEQSLRDEQAGIVDCRTQIDRLNKTIKVVEAEVTVRSDELSVFMREKLKLLNKIDTVVILKMSQLQYFKNDKEFNEIGSALLFNNAIIENLYSRVAQIALETVEAQRKHRINVVHLARMKTDCKHMENQIHKLHERFNDAMLKKFGMIVNFDELQVDILKKMVYEILADVTETQRNYNRKANELQSVYNDKQEILKRLMQEEIEKLNILTILQEEENILGSMLANQSKLTASKKAHCNFEQDLLKLQQISNQQNDQIETLEKEIRTLRMKAKPFSSTEVDKGDIYMASTELADQNDYYEGSVYTGETRSTPESTVNLTAIVKVVDSFLNETLAGHVDRVTLKRLSTKIGQYLGHVAHNFDYEEGESIVDCVVENFLSFIPTECHGLLAEPEIATLFENVLKMCQVKDDIEPAELLHSIVENVRDTLEAQHARNYTQHVICEVLKELIVSMNVEDILRVETVEQLVGILLSMEKIIPKCINKLEMVTLVMEHAIANFVDDLDSNSIRLLIEDISNGLMKNKI